MKVVTIEDAAILIPNLKHKNFTTTDLKIPKGTQIEGNLKYINGLRKGQPFRYRLFYTNNNKIIYTNKIKPIKMETTEVKLGADATIVNVPKQTMDRNVLIGAVVGVIAAYSYAAYKNKGASQKLIYVGFGGMIGMIAGKLITKRKGVTIKK
jgi:hypothetical protein